MCETCLARYRKDIGKPIVPLPEFLQAVMARGEAEADLALMGRDMLATPHGAQMIKLGVQAAVQALGAVLYEEGMIITGGWVGLLGAEAAQERGMIEWELSPHEHREGD